MSENKYKRSGDLESRGFVPLPPTEMTMETKEKLESWGITFDQIQKLMDFNSQFRYDLCPEKMDRLAQTKAELFVREDKEYINFPKFYDVNGRLDGACSDISHQWITQINEIGLIEELNSSMTDGHQISYSFYSGQSKTNFCLEGMIHSWNGLAFCDSHGNIIEEIYFDAAFQTINPKEESGYKQGKATLNVEQLMIEGQIELSIGWVNIIDSQSNSWNGHVAGTAVLGVSDDFKYSFSFGFFKDISTKELRPLITRISPDGSEYGFFYGDEGTLLFTSGAIFTAEEEKEIRTLLDKANSISYEYKSPTTNIVNWNKNDLSG